MKPKQKKKYRIEAVSAAEIKWQDNTAINTRFDDIYFSDKDGIAETEYVFLKQNQLPDAWLGKKQFTVLETGFGTGLNFFCTLDRWFNTSDENAVLTYISVEKYPLTKQSLQQLTEIWPQYSDFINELIRVYPPHVSGFHPCSLFNGRVKCLLLFGDAEEQLSQLQCQADVCYLDGFAPAVNTSMWSASLFMQLARLTKVGGTLSTFTAVGDVRRGLIEAGFEMKKASGFGNKRHMLTGQLKTPSTLKHLKPWYEYPQSKAKAPDVTVIGAGIVGLTTAIVLAEQGVRVTVLERDSMVAAGASGNPAGVVMPRLDKEQNPDAVFYWQAFFTALNYLRHYQRQGLDGGWQQSGILQLMDHFHDAGSDWPTEFFSSLSKQQAQEKSGLVVTKEAAWLKQAGFINPGNFCHSLYQHYKNNIQFEFNTAVEKLIHEATGWRLVSQQKEFHSSAVVICNAVSASGFSQTSGLPLQAVRGQITELNDRQLVSKVKTVICDRGYAIPYKEQLIIGASFQRDDDDKSLRIQDQVNNLKQLNDSLEIGDQINPDHYSSLNGRASIRAMTPDRMPLVGAVPDPDYYQQHYADLARGKRADSYPSAAYYPGLYINSGHGSRGLTSSFLSAEIIAAMLTNGALPVATDLIERLHPARFMIKSYLKQ